MMEICRAEVLRRVENARRQRSRASMMTNTTRDIGVWAVPTEPQPNFIFKDTLRVTPRVCLSQEYLWYTWSGNFCCDPVTSVEWGSDREIELCI